MGKEYEVYGEHIVIRTAMLLLELLQLEICTSENKHNSLKMRATVREKDQQAVLDTDWMDGKITVMERLDAGREIFCGMIEHVVCRKENRLLIVELTAKDRSVCLDREKKKRTFQNPQMAYGQIIEEVLKDYDHINFSPDKKCTLDVTYIEDQEWKAYDESNSQGEGKELLNANESYMICTYGRGYLFFKDAGQVMRSEMEEMAKDQLLVTIEQLQNIPDGWQFRDMVSYDLTTSMPNYADGTRDITQDDVDELNRILWKYEINTPNRIAHFLAQTYVESQRGFGRVERYKTSDLITYFTGEYENNDKAKILGNTEKGDGPLFRGAGAIHITGRLNYQAFSDYMGDERIITDGALYVGQNYYWESAGFYWSIGKPGTANDDRYDLNKKCDENASVEVITGIINGGKSKLEEREKAYAYFSEVIQ